MNCKGQVTVMEQSAPTWGATVTSEEEVEYVVAWGLKIMWTVINMSCSTS